MRAPPPQQKPAPDAYGQQGVYEQDPYASNQGSYQPEFSQQGYNQVRLAATTIFFLLIVFAAFLIQKYFSLNK